MHPGAHAEAHPQKQSPPEKEPRVASPVAGAAKAVKLNDNDDAAARARSLSAKSAASNASGHDASHYADIASQLEAELAAAKLQTAEEAKLAAP